MFERSCSRSKGFPVGTDPVSSVSSPCYGTDLKWKVVVRRPKGLIAKTSKDTGKGETLVTVGGRLVVMTPGTETLHPSRF